MAQAIGGEAEHVLRAVSPGLMHAHMRLNWPLVSYRY